MVSFMPRDALPPGDEVHVTVYHVDDMQAVHIRVGTTGEPPHIPASSLHTGERCSRIRKYHKLCILNTTM
jgi:hypothetical protein